MTKIPFALLLFLMSISSALAEAPSTASDGSSSAQTGGGLGGIVVVGLLVYFFFFRKRRDGGTRVQVPVNQPQWPSPAAYAPPGPSPINREVLVKRYTGSQQTATGHFQRDAERMAEQGYFPTSQSWAPGLWRARDWFLAIVLCVVLIGFIMLLYMSIATPPGTLTVTYERQTV